MSVEWKKLFRESGIENLHVEDWSNEQMMLRSGASEPFPDLMKTFSFREKVEILRRTWQRWGWKGVRTGILKGREIHRLLTRERVLGLELLKGCKAEAGVPVSVEPKSVAAAELGLAFDLTTESEELDSSTLKVVSDAPTSRPEEEGDPDHVETDDVRPDTSGLPLFRPEEEQG
tara:strand:- start:2342 stop:2863 length:522 start_codon:yes stop_codon:yes gene_type:complete